MNLLLLLSALLSALTGAQAQARVAQVPVAVSRAAERAVVRATAAVRADRPVATLPRRAERGELLPAAWALAPAQPTYLSRRRE